MSSLYSIATTDNVEKLIIENAPDTYEKVMAFINSLLMKMPEAFFAKMEAVNALGVAVDHEDDRIFEYLFKVSISDHPSQRRGTALQTIHENDYFSYAYMKILSQGKLSLLKIILESGIDPNIYGCAMLQEAIKHKHHHIIDYAISIGAVPTTSSSVMNYLFLDENRELAPKFIPYFRKGDLLNICGTLMVSLKEKDVQKLLEQIITYRFDDLCDFYIKLLMGITLTTSLDIRSLSMNKFISSEDPLAARSTTNFSVIFFNYQTTRMKMQIMTEMYPISNPDTQDRYAHLIAYNAVVYDYQKQSRIKHATQKNLSKSSRSLDQIYRPRSLHMQTTGMLI
jgi:hypothetical protein